MPALRTLCHLTPADLLERAHRYSFLVMLGADDVRRVKAFSNFVLLAVMVGVIALSAVSWRTGPAWHWRQALI
jgi:hypothetical protein